MDDAGALVAQAEKTGILPREDLLLAKIHLIPNQDTSQELERQDLVVDLARRLAPDSIDNVVQILYLSDQFQAAALMLERASASRPSPARQATQSLIDAMIDGPGDAEKIADEMLMKRRPDELTPLSWFIVFKTIGYAHEGRGHPELAAKFLRDAIEKAPKADDVHLRLHFLLNVAKLRDWQRFEFAVAFCDNHPSERLASRQYDVDALRAFMLTTLDRRDEARAVVAKWRNNSEARRRIIERSKLVAKPLDLEAAAT
jgi:hypothetical protein